jgi:hypothetical protein
VPVNPIIRSGTRYFRHAYSSTRDITVVVRFCWQNDSLQRIFIKQCFLFTVGSVCRVKLLTTGWQKFRWWRRGWDGDAEVAETTVKRLPCCGLRRTGKAMGQFYRCQWRICREMNVFPGSNITCFTFYIYLCPIYCLPEARRWIIECLFR